MRICIFGPHPDDQELGMGGTIRRLAEQGHELLLVDVTDGEPTPFGDHDTRRAEAAAALSVLNEGLDRIAGARPVRRLLLGEGAFAGGGFRNRFVEHSIAARHAIAGVIRAWQAEVLFATYPQDAHPDHVAVRRIVEDARFDSKLSKLEMPHPVDGWTGQRFDPGEGAGDPGRPCHPRWLLYYYATHLRWVADPSLVFDISEPSSERSGERPGDGAERAAMDDPGLVRKLRAIRAYHTQFVLPEKNRRVVEWVAASAVYFGSRIGTPAGEPLFTREPIGLVGLGELT